MEVPGSFRDREAERRARRTEQRRKQRQVERESTDPEIVARRQARAEQVRLKARAWRAQETPEERAQRLATMRVYQARRHSLETPQQREARLEAHRIVLREARKRKAEQNARLHASATNFIDNPLGYICSVCDRLCHLRDIVSVNETWVPVLEQIFPEADVTTFSVCTTCQGSLRKAARLTGQPGSGPGTSTDSLNWWTGRRRPSRPRALLEPDSSATSPVPLSIKFTTTTIKAHGEEPQTAILLILTSCMEQQISLC
ncbi:uncharacterized protein LOC142579810 isoform X2 [Dermacentor variabilis]|uniref:uncharacterized protein LOC142579810 isoform X2 n=1 Tax=Dermacentor variabilis TaxID=34621 RepID=UPI003F5B5CD8